MLNQNEFMETVELVKQIAEASPEPLSRKEILSYFEDMELNSKQKELIFTFFEEKREEEEKEVQEKKQEEEEETGQEENGEDIIQNEQENIVYQMYLEEVEELPVYSAGEEQRLYEQLSDGIQETVKKLSECWMKRVVDLAKKNQVRDVSLQDLIQEGNLALFLELQNLLGKKEQSVDKKKLETVVETAMKSYISEITGEEDSESAILGKVTLLQHAKNILEDEKQRTPTKQELAEYTNMTLDEIEDIFALVKENPDTKI